MMNKCIVDIPDRKYTSLEWSNVNLIVHVFQLDEDGASEEMTSGEGGDDSIPSCTQWLMPSTEFHGLWDSLIYDSQIKQSLLNFAHTAMVFSDKKVDRNIITWNRVVLLHGPPGTGKTSLCKALAQKLSIRLSKRYPCATLLEINAHSLFSKWFSESGKLVMKLFAHIHELVEDEDNLVIVLIDEVIFPPQFLYVSICVFFLFNLSLSLSLTHSLSLSLPLSLSHPSFTTPPSSYLIIYKYFVILFIYFYKGGIAFIG